MGKELNKSCRHFTSGLPSAELELTRVSASLQTFINCSKRQNSWREVRSICNIFGKINCWKQRNQKSPVGLQRGGKSREFQLCWRQTRSKMTAWLLNSTLCGGHRAKLGFPLAWFNNHDRTGRRGKWNRRRSRGISEIKGLRPYIEKSGFCWILFSLNKNREACLI